jgi:osmotically-inducible protein OsmY
MKRLLLCLPLLYIASACAPVALAGAGAGGVVAGQERTAGAALDDATIHTKIYNKFFMSNVNNLYSNVAIEVSEGVVLLTGVMPNVEDAAAAVQMAWDVEGVREVINEIQVTNRGGPEQFAKDGWITTQARARLIAEKGVKSVNYTIETVNNVAYVMGIAQSENELARVLNVVSRVKGVERVVSHVRLKTDPRRPINMTGTTPQG